MTLHTTTHHPAPDLLLSYSAGTASTAQAICIATHLDFCPSCRMAHRRNNAIGGMLMSSRMGVSDRHTVSESRKHAVMVAIQARQDMSKQDSKSGGEAPAPLPEPVDHNVDVPRPLRAVLPDGFDRAGWKMATWSVRNAQLSKEPDGAVVSLLKIRAGARVNHHGHLGDEYTVILKGSFSDEDGRYGPGDFLLRQPGEHHSPVATRDADCICLTAQEAPLQFSNGIWKLLNPLLRWNF